MTIALIAKCEFSRESVWYAMLWLYVAKLEEINDTIPLVAQIFIFFKSWYSMNKLSEVRLRNTHADWQT